jgi:hypothetical protein
MSTLIAFLNDNPTTVVGFFVWLVTTEILPFIPGPYNGIVQSIIKAIADNLKK